MHSTSPEALLVQRSDWSAAWVVDFSEDPWFIPAGLSPALLHVCSRELFEYAHVALCRFAETGPCAFRMGIWVVVQWAVSRMDRDELNR